MHRLWVMLLFVARRVRRVWLRLRSRCEHDIKLSLTCYKCSPGLAWLQMMSSGRVACEHDRSFSAPFPCLRCDPDGKVGICHVDEAYRQGDKAYDEYTALADAEASVEAKQNLKSERDRAVGPERLRVADVAVRRMCSYSRQMRRRGHWSDPELNQSASSRRRAYRWDIWRTTYDRRVKQKWGGKPILIARMRSDHSRRGRDRGNSMQKWTKIHELQSRLPKLGTADGRLAERRTHKMVANAPERRAVRRQRDRINRQVWGTPSTPRSTARHRAMKDEVSSHADA